MKQFLIIGLLIFFYNANFCMEITGITEEQHKCFLYFVNSPFRIEAVQSLSQNDKNIILNGILYSEKPQETITALENMCTSFYNLTKEKNVIIPWDKNFLSNALLKERIALKNKVIIPIDEISARQFVFSQLSSEEKEKIYMHGYIKNPEAARQIFDKMSVKIADILAGLNFIENTPEAKKIKAAQYVEEKMKNCEDVYIKSNPS